MTPFHDSQFHSLILVEVGQILTLYISGHVFHSDMAMLTYAN